MGVKCSILVKKVCCKVKDGKLLSYFLNFGDCFSLFINFLMSFDVSFRILVSLTGFPHCLAENGISQRFLQMLFASSR